MRKFVLILLFAFPVVAQAYPWCLVRDGVPHCRFVSSESCYKATAKFGGDCRLNARELGLISNRSFCVVTGEYRDCRYSSKQLCLRNARTLKGGCVRNTDKDLQRSAAGLDRSGGCFMGEEGCQQIDPELLEDTSGVSDDFSGSGF
ncbi:MAG TPA: hypothetical protein QF799_12260 [Gammaproteobacteria bacterium]|nr:hypothetical protein [Gammaproteobacteria bacterium]